MKLRILPDECASSFDGPRDWDNAGLMVCWHGRYNLGDDHRYSCDDFNEELACDWDSELSEELERLDYDVYNALLERAARNGVDSPWEQSKYARRLIDPKKRKLIDEVLDRGVVIELFFYDHSGCAMNTTGFGCRWDSDPVGYIVCDPETIEREFAGDFDRAEKAIQAEVKVYSQWLEGDVWGYVLEDDEGNEIDSCWGFYGSDPKENGIADCVDLDVCEVVYE